MMEKVLGCAWMNQPRHSLKPKPNLRQGPNSNSVRGEVRKLQKKGLKLAGVDFVKFKEVISTASRAEQQVIREI